jgi:hypothetical protein
LRPHLQGLSWTPGWHGHAVLYQNPYLLYVQSDGLKCHLRGQKYRVL